MKREALLRRFPAEQVKQRHGPAGKVFSYIEAHNVVARLIEACEDGGWTFEIVEHQLLDNEVVVLARLTVDGVTKMAFGGASITKDASDRPLSIADDMKAAASDALKKAATLFGVGLEQLYGAQQNEPSVVVPIRATAAQEERLTDRQHSTLEAITRRRNIRGSHLTALLERRFKKSALEDLTRREASAFISELDDVDRARG